MLSSDVQGTRSPSAGRAGRAAAAAWLSAGLVALLVAFLAAPGRTDATAALLGLALLAGGAAGWRGLGPVSGAAHPWLLAYAAASLAGAAWHDAAGHGAETAALVGLGLLFLGAAHVVSRRPAPAAPPEPGEAADDEEDEETLAALRGLPVRRILGFVLRSVAKHPFLVASLFALSAAVALAELASVTLVIPFLETLRGGEPTLTRQLPFSGILPDIATMSTVAVVRWLAGGLVVVQLVRSVFSYASGRVSAYLKVLLEQDLRQVVFDDLLRVELSFIHREKAGDLFTIMHSYPRTAAALVADTLAGLNKGIVFLAYVWFMLFVSWELTLLAVSLGLVSVLAIGRIRTAIRRIGRRINVSRQRLHQVTLESLSAMKVIRLFGREDHARERFLHEVRTLRSQSFRSGSLSALAPPVQNLVYVGLFAVLLVAATVVLDTSTREWVLVLLVFMVILIRLMVPLGALSRKQTRVSAELPALEALLHYVERQDKTYLTDGDRAFERLREGIRFEGVSFAYDPAQGPVLRGVDLEIPRGSVVALVGASGSGKSTTVNLLARLADPTEGRILVDGVDLRAFQATTWRRRVAVVSQETFLFNTTVRENIRFGRLDATDAEVEEAAGKARAHDFILQMEQGYDTPVGDRGVRLSGGQAQRIAIARALLADPDVLVLDEATSALDAETERLVQEALEEAARGRTVVAIAHRLSTVRRADQILVLEKGEIVERGTHEHLMAKRGRYAEYVGLQDLLSAPAAKEPRRGAAKRPRPGEA